MTRKLTVILLSIASAAWAEPHSLFGPQRNEDRPRLRLGAGYWAAIKRDGSPYPVGTTLQLGVQFNDHFAVYGSGEVAWFVDQVANTSLLGEFTTGNGYWSFATGVGTSFLRDTCVVSCSTVPSIIDRYVGLPVRISLNLGPAATGAARHRFFFALDGFVGTAFGREISIPNASALSALSPWIYNVGLGFGYQMM